MRIPFLSSVVTSPLNDVQEHAEKVKECSRAFEQAMACHMNDRCQSFETHRQDVIRLESEADSIKRRIRGHIPKEALMPVHKFELFMYLKEQDKVLDAVEDALNWLAHRTAPGIPDDLKDDFLGMAEAVIEPIEALSAMVKEARAYFKTYSDEQRTKVKNIIRDIRQKEHEADIKEEALKHKIFAIQTEAVTVFHTIKLTEIIGSIADHAENAGDMMRAMIAR